MAPTNLMQPRLPTTPFEIYVPKTQLWVSLLLVDMPNTFCGHVLNINKRLCHFLLNKIELYINCLEREILLVFLEKATAAELSQNNFNGLEMESTTPKLKQNSASI